MTIAIARTMPATTVEDERHTQDAADSVEDEVQMYPAGGEKEDGAEDAHDPQNALVAFGHSLTRFRLGDPLRGAFYK